MYENKKKIAQRNEPIKGKYFIYFSPFYQFYVLSIKKFDSFFSSSFYVLFLSFYFLLASKLNSWHFISGLLVEGSFHFSFE